MSSQHVDKGAGFGSCQAVVAHADGTVISASSPAKMSEEIVIYTLGLGETTPPVSTGEASPIPAAVVASSVNVQFDFRPNAGPSRPYTGVPLPVPLRRACALEMSPMEESRSLLRLAVEPEAPPLSYFRNVPDSRERVTRVKADMQAGKTYYFRWSIPYAPFQAAKAPQLELVDDATGAKEVSRLRRAER